MSIENRAKIFAPFAALKGHEEAIAAKRRIVVPRVELSEEAKEYLDWQLAKIEQMLDAGKHPMVTIIYFQKDKMCTEDEDGGEYIQFTGIVAKYHLEGRWIQIVDKKLRLEDIYGIENEED
ncbi:MAG: YolD-like family protein [Clostridia bacterium]|nr:YolD-like family protein [Clostridia bacterium]NCD03333.1 YolD-like family protein [Clostridia bacterium]